MELRELVALKEHPHLDFWTEVGLGRKVDIMVTPTLRASMLARIRSIGLEPEVMIQDVQEVIDQERAQQPTRSKEAGMTWDDYYNYTEVTETKKIKN